MLYITGDCHIPHDIHKLSSTNFPAQKTMTRQDYVLICGDFGGFWDNSKENRYWLKWLEEKPFTTLFIDGNHENFDMLDALPEVDFMGGRAHRGGEHLYHLMRGYVFELDGRRVFTMGGASSHDREFRIPGRSWWARELPDPEEYARGLRNLEKAGWNVDYIVTHCAPGFVQDRVCYYQTGRFHYEKDELTGYLQQVDQACTFRKWFFGHYHLDLDLDPYRAVYMDILEA